METRIAEFKSAEVLAERGVLYAILDACDVRAIPDKFKGMSDQRVRSLFKGGSNEQLWHIAPYLVRVTPHLLQWMTSELWSGHWGIFFVPKAERSDDFAAIWAHFRRMLMVNAGGRWLYFRFYDPRVLKDYLPTCTSEQLKEFFGPLALFGAACAEPFAGEATEITWFLMDEQAVRQSLAKSKEVI